VGPTGIVPVDLFCGAQAASLPTKFVFWQAAEHGRQAARAPRNLCAMLNSKSEL